jgi:hypothetical protein
MHGRIGVEEDGIHRISTRFKGARINGRPGDEVIDPSGLSLLHANALGGLLLRFIWSNPGMILVIVKLLRHRLIDIEHHDIEHTIGIVILHIPLGMIRHKHEPVIARHGSESVPIPVETFAQITMTVEIIHLLVERTVWEHLIPREIKVLAVVPHPIDLEADFTTQFNKRGDASEEGGGTARFEYNHVGVDEEGTLAEDVSVQVAVGYAGEDSAAGAGADAIEVGSGEGA